MNDSGQATSQVGQIADVMNDSRDATLSGWEGWLPPQRGCPAGDPGLAPAVFEWHSIQAGASRPSQPVRSSALNHFISAQS